MKRNPSRRCFDFWLLILVCYLEFGVCNFSSSDEFIPRKQTKPPHPARSPAEALKHFTVPEGFSIELVAAEPDLVNPVAMTFDERGRIWVTESFEYPRKEPGPGRDRVKILEDTDHNGAVDKVTIFAEGLNIPSGIAVGHGGVWVANAPDILFYPDADRDGTADGPPQVVVTGFGRADTHELPNSLTWGPDGYLYGLNGVFNPSKIVQNGKTFEFTCAMFRIDPRTREFGLFCEGTSNPWGIAFNENGDAFVSACVIDHLWHLVETGYYHRQGGPYPPFTWKLGSIVDYKHQMAAYCGITWFDSDAYPEQYRRKLYMGNIHGGCINCDRVERNGATYKGFPEPDFLTANDVWFMPVVQKTGPDGCLYILDWYDRYHCYQDANYDPAGVDRAKGRLYRVRYQNTPRAEPFDLAKETDDQLIARLGSPNIFYREIAQRLLGERADPKTQLKLVLLVHDQKQSRTVRLHALWTLIGIGAFSAESLATVAENVDPAIRAWCVRTLGNRRDASSASQTLIAKLAKDESPDVRLQAAIAACKVSPDLGLNCLMRLLENPKSQDVTGSVIWQNLLPLMSSHRQAIGDEAAGLRAEFSPAAAGVFPRIIDWLLADESSIADVVRITLAHEDGITLAQCLTPIAARLQDGELKGERAAALRTALDAKLHKQIKRTGSVAAIPAAAILCSGKDLKALDFVRAVALSASEPPARRMEALDAWAAAHDPVLFETLDRLVLPTTIGPDDDKFRRRVFDVLVTYDDDAVAKEVLSVYSQLESELRPAAIELLTSRVPWSNALLDAIAAGTVPKDAVNVNQIRKLLKSGDKELAARVEQTWGKLRTDRNPQREQVVAEMRKLLAGSHGDAANGQVVFMKLCGQCHKLHGTGQDVGPDITVNGRSSFEQLLNNVFDPSLVIGNAYQARTVVTDDGRVLTGLLVEDNPQRIVLKLQGGKLETIARGDVEEMEISKLSLMPEGVEKQLSAQELIDLFALLKLDKPPSDPQSKPLPNFTELK